MSVSDYLVEVKVKNGRIARLMRRRGFGSLYALAKAGRLNYGALCSLVSFRLSPMDRNGRYRKVVRDLADTLQVDCDDLFSAEQLSLEVNSNKRDYFLSHEEVMRLSDRRESPDLLPDEIVDQNNMEAVIDDVLDTLTTREREVIELCFGIGGKDEHSLREAGKKLGVSVERVYQLQSKALRKLRHTSRSTPLLIAQGKVDADVDPNAEGIADELIRELAEVRVSAGTRRAQPAPENDRHRPIECAVCGIVFANYYFWQGHNCLIGEDAKTLGMKVINSDNPSVSIEGYIAAFRQLACMNGYAEDRFQQILKMGFGKLATLRAYYRELKDGRDAGEILQALAQ